jgi:hypothetical protein
MPPAVSVPLRALLAALLLLAAGAGCVGSFTVPDGYLDPCSGEADTGCAAGLDCVANPGPADESAYVCSSRCTDASDCPSGTKACGDGDATQCRSGVCYYSALCY